MSDSQVDELGTKFTQTRLIIHKSIKINQSMYQINRNRIIKTFTEQVPVPEIP